MKRFLMLAALGLVGLCSTTTTAYSQSRDLGAQRLILDNGGTGRLTLEYTGTGSSTFTFPSGSSTSVPTGTLASQTLYWDGAEWVAATNFYNDGANITGTGAVTFGGRINSDLGFSYQGYAPSGQYLRGDGSHFVSSAIQSADLPAGSGNYIRNGTTPQAASFNIQGTGNLSNSASANTLSVYNSYYTAGTAVGATIQGQNSVGPAKGLAASAYAATGHLGTAISATSGGGVPLGIDVTAQGGTPVGIKLLSAGDIATGMAMTVGGNTAKAITINSNAGAATGVEVMLTGGVLAGISTITTGGNTNRGGVFMASGGFNTTAGTFSASGGVNNIGVDILAGGLRVEGGINNTTDGITNAGAISGATTVSATGTIATTGGNIALPTTTASAGQITIGGAPFMHAYNNGTFVGLSAGNFTLGGTGTVGIGRSALAAQQVADYNTAVGDYAMTNTTTGGFNTAIGYQALTWNTTGTLNTAVGISASALNTSGNRNTAVGSSALQENLTGEDNTAVGMSALYGATGSENTGLGYNAATQTTGNGNTAVGYSSMMSLTSGTDNTAIGHRTDVTVPTVTNVTLLGAGATTGTSNTVVLGNTSVTEVVTAGNINAPSATLSSLSVAAGVDKYAGSITTDDASVDSIEIFNNSLITTSSIIIVTLNSELGATQIVNAVPGAGSVTVKFTANVVDGSKLSYIIVNP